MVVAMVLLAGCAGSRPEVIDALTGQPVEAQIRSLDGGRLLVSANGYEMRVAQPGELVELVPLWQERFMNAAEPRESVKPREARPCCPGQTTR